MRLDNVEGAIVFSARNYYYEATLSCFTKNGTRLDNTRKIPASLIKDTDIVKLEFNYLHSELEKACVKYT